MLCHRGKAFFVGLPGPEPYCYMVDYQHTKKSHCKNDYKNHCEMFDTKKFDFSLLINCLYSLTISIDDIEGNYTF